MVSAQSNTSYILATMYGFSKVKHVAYTNYGVLFQRTQSNMTHILTTMYCFIKCMVSAQSNMSYILNTMYGFSTVKHVAYTNYDVWFQDNQTCRIY